MPNHVSSAGSQSSQNCPKQTIPWWFARRAARRKEKVKGSSPPGLKNPACVAPATGRSGDHARPGDQAKAKGTYAQVLKTPVKSGPRIQPPRKVETRPIRSIQVEIRRVVHSFGAELRRLVRDVRSQIFQKKDPKKTGKLSSSFVPEKKKPKSPHAATKFKATEFMNQRPMNVTVTQPVVIRPSGGFELGFDYKKHELGEQARIEWRKLANRLATLNKTIQTPLSISVVYDAQAASKLIAMYIADFGREHFNRFKYELECICGYQGTIDVNRLLDSAALKPMFVSAGLQQIEF